LLGPDEISAVGIESLAREIDDRRAALTFANGTAVGFPNQSGAWQMSRRIMLAVFSITVTAMTASAADLPAQSRLGAIFAAPEEVRVVAYRSVEYSAPIIGFNLLPDPPWARGGYYYGSSWSYYYPGPYYGGPYYTDGARLPSVCGLYGYCF
jgi:hypothetical protein